MMGAGATCSTLRGYAPSGTPLGEFDNGANLAAVAVDTSDNLYIAGTQAGLVSLRALDSSLNPLWVADLVGKLTHVAVDSAGGWVYVAGNNFLRQFNLSTGAQTTTGNWPVTFGAATALTVDASGNIWIGHQSPLTTTGNQVNKYSSAGDLLLSCAPFSPIGHQRWPSAMGADSSGNVWVTSTSAGFPSANSYVVKLDSSGAVTWSHAMVPSVTTIDALHVSTGGISTYTTWISGTGRAIQQRDTSGAIIPGLTGPAFNFTFDDSSVPSGLLYRGVARNASDGRIVAVGDVQSSKSVKSYTTALNWSANTVQSARGVVFDSSGNAWVVSDRDCS